MLILSKYYDHYDYSDTLTITEAVITLYPFISSRLPFFSTNSSPRSLSLCLADKTHTHHRHTHCAWVSAAAVAAEWSRGRPHPAIIPGVLVCLKAALRHTEWWLNGRPAGSLLAGEESDEQEGEHTQSGTAQANVSQSRVKQARNKTCKSTGKRTCAQTHTSAWCGKKPVVLSRDGASDHREGERSSWLLKYFPG